MLIKARHTASAIIKITKNISRPITTNDKENKIKVGKYYINYLKVGNGEHNVLCMPGALGTIQTDFKYQVEEFNRDKFTLVVWDPPGYGKSRPPEKDFPADFYHEDAATAADFMKALNIPKYSVLGWSDGASSSFIVAARNPEAVKKLVVWGANSFILPHELVWYQKLKDVSTWSKTMRDTMAAVYGEEGFVNYWAKWQAGMERVFTTNNGNICKELVKDIKCPIFVLYGQKDPLVDKVHTEYIQSQVPNTRIHLYPNGKHNVHIHYAKDFNKRVQDFLLE